MSAPDDTWRAVGERLRELREKDLRMSARELQEELRRRGVQVDSHTTILRYERGRVPRADYVLELARLAGVSPSWVLSGEEPRVQPADGRDLYRAGQHDVAWRVARRLAHIMEDLHAIDATIPVWPGGPLRPLPPAEGKKEAGGAD